MSTAAYIQWNRAKRLRARQLQMQQIGLKAIYGLLAADLLSELIINCLK